MKSNPSIQSIQKKIQSLQREIAQLGFMRPGSLSRQYREPHSKRGAYYQLSYTYQMKSKTEYIHPESVPQIRRELSEYKRYKQLNQEWIQLSIELSRLQIKAQKSAANPIAKNS